MCTAISYFSENHYFGRNLDLDRTYSESVVITPRQYPLSFRNGKCLSTHHAIIGMAAVAEGYPLYFDATNEKGLSIAGLNFPDNAAYLSKQENMDNIAPFELIPWILGQCETVSQAKTLLQRTNLWKLPFSRALPLSPLHWLLSDKHHSLALEPMPEGLRVLENPVGTLTNNPPFDFHMHNLTQYLNLTVCPPENRFSQEIDLKPFSFGMGAIGLPGDLSSASRFIRAVFTKYNAHCADSEATRIGQFFHILTAVSQTKGLTELEGGIPEYTLYTSCCNTDRGIYYYTTYENRQITAVDMHKVPLDGKDLFCYPLKKEQNILHQNS